MLTLNNVSKSFAGVFSPILDGINLELTQGDFCILIGANGSGKSTLMKTIAGEYPVNSGEILLDSKLCSAQERSQYIAQVVQDVHKGTIPEMTLLENIALSQMRSKRAQLGFYVRYKQKAIKHIAELGLGLEAKVNQSLANLSGGQRQLVATIMAISSQPKILLLDEHTSALDPNTQQILMNYTAANIAKYTLTCMMITHKLEDALKYGNRLLMLHQGQIVVDINGQAKAALNSSELRALFHKYSELTLEARA
jgi:putative tryptophan/tyrosine transport system ATP-binding protein